MTTPVPPAFKDFKIDTISIAPNAQYWLINCTSADGTQKATLRLPADMLMVTRPNP